MSIHLTYVTGCHSIHPIRNESLVAALASAPDIRLSIVRNRSGGRWGYLQLLQALYRSRKQHRTDIYMLGFRGHEMFWPVYGLARGKPVIIDGLMSPQYALKEEKKFGLSGRFMASLLNPLEKGILAHAAMIMTDTESHAYLYATRFGIPKDKIITLPVGALEKEPTMPGNDTDTVTPMFNVLFFGSILPLQGIHIIIHAARKLGDLPIRFDFVSNKPRQIARLCARHGVTRYTIRPWLPMQKLINHIIPMASICLGGPFGDTPQANRIITGKALQCLAQGKVTVIGENTHTNGFFDKKNCLLVPRNDPDALAQAIHWAFFHQSVLTSIGLQGQMLYNSQFSVKVIARKLIPAIRQLIPPG